MTTPGMLPAGAGVLPPPRVPPRPPLRPARGSGSLTSPHSASRRPLIPILHPAWTSPPAAGREERSCRASRRLLPAVPSCAWTPLLARLGGVFWGFLLVFGLPPPRDKRAGVGYSRAPPAPPRPRVPVRSGDATFPKAMDNVTVRQGESATLR
ncbi:hypothetical protein DV515_00011080 [Chloebia gouldiae]|uniref:Uncharacterized protein n=1 Tax=Chloebia gouldiae TaxID=44316 RepID=A0A3L8S7D7_CHLGU|nr:hypothetical protein DV515_00011080 [Chloebia gouldiae]